MSNDIEYGWPSPRATRVGLLILMPLAVAIGIRAVSWAAPKLWSDGEVLTAADLNASFKSLADSLAQGREWFACGNFRDLLTDGAECQIAGFPPDEFEYGFKHLSSDARAINCGKWNVGYVISHRHPFLVNTANPSVNGAQLGGVMFYTRTAAEDDDECSRQNKWRHRYWQIVNGSVDTTTLGVVDGCYDDMLFCRRI